MLSIVIPDLAFRKCYDSCILIVFYSLTITNLHWVIIYVHGLHIIAHNKSLGLVF